MPCHVMSCHVLRVMAKWLVHMEVLQPADGEAIQYEKHSTRQCGGRYIQSGIMVTLLLLLLLLLLVSNMFKPVPVPLLAEHLD